MRIGVVVMAAAIGAGCAATSKAPLRVADTTPAPSPIVVKKSPDPLPPPALVPPALAGAGTTTPPAPNAPAVELMIEKPFLAWERPRPSGRIAGAAHDEELSRWNMGGTGDATFPSNRPGFHAAPRVRVDTTLVAGHLSKSARLDRRTGKHDRVLSQTSLLARSRKYGYWPFRLCFEEGLRRDQKLGGKTRLRFRVTTSGSIRGGRLVDTKLSDPEVAKCLVEAAPEIRLLPPPRGIDVELLVSLWPGDAAVPSLEDAPETPAKLDSEAIAASLGEIRTAFSDCYADGRTRDPALWGRLELGIEVDEAGAIKDVRERDSRFPDPEVTTCAISAAKSWALSPKKGRPSFVIGLRFGTPPMPETLDN